MTRQQGELLRKLIGVAGDPFIVEEALKQLNHASAEAPTLNELLVRIFELKNEHEREALAHGATESISAGH